jgi:hypothetical protein
VIDEFLAVDFKPVREFSCGISLVRRVRTREQHARDPLQERR